MMEYIYLTFAIILELIGTTLLKYTKGFTLLLPTITCLTCYGFCYFFFSKCLNQIHLSVAYASWCGIGIVVSTLFSIYILKESITIYGVIGIIFVILGVILLNVAGTH